MQNSKTITCALIFACGMFAAIPAAQAATIIVSTDSGGTGGPDCTLRDAITAANTDTPTGGCPAGSGPDIIELPVGATITLTEPDNDTDGPNGLPSISSEVIINGNGSIVERDGADETPEFRIFFVAADGGLTLENLTVRNGLFETARYGTGGGGIRSVGSLTLTDSTVSGNTADFGGGIYTLGNLTLTDSTVSGNTGDDGGGGILGVGSLTLTDSTVSGNTSDDGGGGIFADGTLILIHSTVSGNFGGLAGGGIANHGVLMLTDSTVSNNETQGFGGGIFNLGTATATNSTISGNVDSFHGGGIVNGGTFTLINSTISGNVDNNGGGGIWNSGADSVLTLIDSTVSGNTTNSGGGIIVHGALVTLTGSTVCGNEPDQILGGYTDGGGNLVAEECPACSSGDLDGDGVVGPIDLAILLGSWGPCAGCPADINDDGQVGPLDLATLLASWGPCP